MKIYLVGGAVRDKILGLKSKDLDYSVVSSKDDLDAAYNEMKEYIQSKGEIFLETSDCFTIRARIDNDCGDFVLARKELGYIEGTRKPICIPGSIYDDLERRDFTCNAIAESEDGFYDPFNGIEACKNKILDTPLDPYITFMDDPLRILRALRFHVVKGFIFSERVYQALLTKEEIYKKLFDVDIVSKERVREELLKMFKFDTCKTLNVLLGIFEFENLQNLLGDLWLKPTFEK